MGRLGGDEFAVLLTGAGAGESDKILQRLGELVDELPPSRREALDLWSAGFTYRQIAQIAGYTEANVRVLVHRAIQQLRRHPAVQRLHGSPAIL